MLSPDGRLFHIDFGYILGNDPKPFPPPMKLCREMIEAMGGQVGVSGCNGQRGLVERWCSVRPVNDLPIGAAFAFWSQFSKVLAASKLKSTGQSARLEGSTMCVSVLSTQCIAAR